MRGYPVMRDYSVRSHQSALVIDTKTPGNHRRATEFTHQNS